MRSRISIRGYVRPSIRPSVTHELIQCKSAVFDQNYYQYEREHILCRVSGLVVYGEWSRSSLLEVKVDVESQVFDMLSEFFVG